MKYDAVVVGGGIADEVIRITDKSSIATYEAFLNNHFPDNKEDIAVIIRQIRKIMGNMDVLYGIDNPALMDLPNNKKYLFGTLLPWLFRFLFTMRRINCLQEPVEQYLQRLTNNPALVDIIAQHFFKHTPTSFALSYFSLFLDYQLEKQIENFGWAAEMKTLMEEWTITILDESIFPGLRDKVSRCFSASPRTLEKLTGNTDGALTGWAFTNPVIPAVSKMLKVNDAVITPIPGVWQAGQWTYSPSGFPMSIVTGKLAFDQVLKNLKS